MHLSACKISSQKDLLMLDSDNLPRDQIGWKISVAFRLSLLAEVGEGNHQTLKSCHIMP